MVKSFCTLLFLLSIANSVAIDTVVVTTRYGTLRGIRETTNPESYVDIFHNVPYAHPPVGNLRFKKPLPAERWTGVRDATQIGPQCPQKYRSLPPAHTFVTREDCLYLNVYRPKVMPEDGPLPVMVWIHGGSYVLGSGNLYDGRQLAAKGVIVVTINYRLGALGFYSTESDVSVGNYGMWDIIQALQWVQDTISAFKGDPNSVTLFGESSGSTSVSLLLLSPSVQGLFHKAIMESGVSLTSWAVAHRGIANEARTEALILAKGLHCDVSDSAQKMACLRAKDAMAIVNVTTDMEHAQQDMVFSPVIEGAFGQQGLFPQTPFSALDHGFISSVSAIRGYNKYESRHADPENDGISLQEFQNSVHNLAYYIRRYSSLSEEAIQSLLLDAYITTPNITEPKMIREAYLQLATDYGFVAPTIEELKFTTRRSPNPQYLYQFSFRSANRLSPPWQGALHTDEIDYVFGTPVSNHSSVWDNFVTSWTARDRQVSDEVMTLWTNFAKYGNPTSDNNCGTWLPWTQASPNLREIGATSTVVSAVRTHQISVWNDVIVNRERGDNSVVG